MLRLIIVDDEKIIRETICNLIDWNSIGIEVVGLCKNGYDAYEMILDEYPDIVMTDIKMPGLSGLELIKRISQADQDIEFVILSGFGEFSFAKEAMELGVKHYLLKPTNEVQIIQVMEKVTDDCYSKKAFANFEKEKQLLLKKLHESIIRNIITEGLSSDTDLSLLIDKYGQFLDLKNQNYELCFFYYLQENNLSECMNLLFEYNKRHFPGIPLFTVYVKNTLIVFFEGFNTHYEEFDKFASGLSFPDESVTNQYERLSCKNLGTLLHHIIYKLKRYEKIYILNGVHKTLTYNYTLFQDIEKISTLLANVIPDNDRTKILTELNDLLHSVNDPDLLKTLITNLLIKQQMNASITCSPMYITEFLLEISKYDDSHQIYQSFLDRQPDLIPDKSSVRNNYQGFVGKLIDYVNNNLSNPDLTLKVIAENHLFMNVDYVSKQFIKQTDCKFSSYLINARIEKAKLLLLECPTEKICSIAEEIGYGNNPQYFSQLFKKHTNMTPTEYVKKMRGINKSLLLQQK